MKKLLLLMCIIGMLLFVVGCNKEESIEKYSLEDNDLKGDVFEVMHKLVAEDIGDGTLEEFDVLPIYEASQYKLVFNEDGFVDYSVFYIDDNEVLAKLMHEYDDNNLVKSLVYNVNMHDGSYKMTETYDLDDNGNVIIDDGVMILNHDDPQGPNYVLKIIVDDQNREIERFKKEGDRFKSTQKTSYHKNGKFEQNVFDTGSSVMTLNATYDKDDNLSGLQVDRNGEIKNYTFDYEFDDQGNWVEQRAYQDGTLISKMMREITYK